MQEPHVEGIANHNGPESCEAFREGRVEALTGGSAGQPLSFVSYLLGADRVVLSGRHYRQPRHREGCWSTSMSNGRMAKSSPSRSVISHARQEARNHT